MLVYQVATSQHGVDSLCGLETRTEVVADRLIHLLRLHNLLSMEELGFEPRLPGSLAATTQYIASVKDIMG